MPAKSEAVLQYRYYTVPPLRFTKETELRKMRTSLVVVPKLYRESGVCSVEWAELVGT